ncbi:unnamed protein product [Calypogeia fissa]
MVNWIHSCRAELKSQVELQDLEVLRKEKIEWQEEKKRLANDVILERSIASKAAAETKDLKKLVEKERSTISTQARLILSQDDQLSHRNTVIVQWDNKIKLLLLENNSLTNIIKGLELDNIKVE